MSTAVADEITADTPPEGTTAAESGTKGLFKWSAYVHVGDGAEGCPGGENGQCRDPDHFHAWVRLPNQFQMRDITEKATAAKARKIRALKDPDSDARVILEGELDNLRDPALKTALVDDIVDKDFQEIYVQAVREVDDIDADIPELESEDEGSDAEPVKKYATIDQDREEYQRQLELPEDQRDEDFERLEAWVDQHTADVTRAREEIIEARRAPLMDRDMEELIDILRRDRIEMAGSEAYLNAFNTWQWFACTYKPVAKGRPNERVFRDYNQMRYEADSEVINALNTTFDDLRLRLSQTRAVKKS